MNAAEVLLFLLAASAGGYAVVRFWSSGLTRSETLAWSFAAGQLVEAVILLAILAAHGIPGPKKILGAEALLVTASFVWRRRASRPRVFLPASGGPRWAVMVLLGIAAAGVLLFLGVALSAPMNTTDFLAIWGLKGRVIFVTSSIPGRLFHDPALAWAHPEYPLLIPSSFAVLASAIRRWDDRALALLYPACQAATVLLVWGFLRRRVSAESGAAAAALTASCLPLYSRGNVGTGELPVALAFVLAATAAADWRYANSGDAVARLGIAALFSATVKEEGALLVVLIAASLLAIERRRAWAAVAAVVAPVLAHGALLRLLRGPVVRRDYDLTLLEPHRWAELLPRIAAVARRLGSVEVAHAALALAVIGAFFLMTRRSFADWLMIPIGIQLLVYASLCAVCRFGAVWLVEASFSRITLALFPAFLIVLGARLGPTRREPA